MSFWRILDAEQSCNQNWEALKMKTFEVRSKVQNYHQHQNFAIQKTFLRGINFVKITKNIFQATRLPEERMGVTAKIGGRNEFP